MMTTRIAYAAAAAPRSSSLAKLGEMPGMAMATLRLWLRRRHDRHALLQLDNHMLRDIGFDRARVKEMAARPFWRA
jgi:uncharacterized protein YjiS (DUF1127 family)